MRFLGSASSADDVRDVILGVPMDQTCCFRPGTRFGPREIRNFSDNLELFSIEQGRELPEGAFFDAGDLELTVGDIDTTLDEIAAAVGDLLDEGKRPICLGGEHLVTAGIIRAFAQRFPDLCVLHVDAHYDLRAEWLGSELSHATALRNVWNLCDMTVQDDPPRLVQIGIRSGPREEWEFATAHIPQHTPRSEMELVDFVSEWARRWEGRPVYCTFDIDAVDPAFAPGTGTPEAGGLTSREALAVMRSLNLFQLVGFDLVEVSPPWDPSGITAALASKMVRELLIALHA